MHAALLLTLLAATNADEFDRQIEKLLKDSNTVGCAIAFADNGKLTFAKGYGFADLEHKVVMKPDSVHELASVSKQFTAVSILQLAEQGRLNLDDKLSSFFKDAHSDWSKVTVRHMLHHTSGLPDYLSGLRGFAVDYTWQQLLDAVKDKPLKFEPGSKFEYSNTGYMLLGQIVAERTGKSFGEATQSLFKQAGMKSAVYNNSRTVVPNRAEGYSVARGTILREAFTSSTLSGTGDGHVLASAVDLVAWDAALRSGKLLNAAGIALMNTPSDASKAEMSRFKLAVSDAGYACGVMVGLDGKKLVQTHTGGWMGTNTMFNRYVDDKKCLVILCNSEGAPLEAIAKLCEKRFLGRLVVAKE